MGKNEKSMCLRENKGFSKVELNKQRTLEQAQDSMVKEEHGLEEQALTPIFRMKVWENLHSWILFTYMQKFCYWIGIQTSWKNVTQCLGTIASATSLGMK